MLERNKLTLIKVAALGLVTSLFGGVANASPVDQSIAIEKQVMAASSKSQKKINRFAEQTVDMAADYKSTLRIIESLKIYNNQLEILIDSQEKEIHCYEKEKRL